MNEAKQRRREWRRRTIQTELLVRGPITVAGIGCAVHEVAAMLRAALRTEVRISNKGIG
jgi:hypothetical protein